MRVQACWPTTTRASWWGIKLVVPPTDTPSVYRIFHPLGLLEQVLLQPLVLVPSSQGPRWLESLQLLPAGHDAVAHDYAVTRDEGDGDVFGEVEHGKGAARAVLVAGTKIGFSLPQLFQHHADVTQNVGGQLPGQLVNLTGRHGQGLAVVDVVIGLSSVAPVGEGGSLHGGLLSVHWLLITSREAPLGTLQGANQGSL